MTTSPILTVSSISKSYAELRAVDDVSFSVQRGEVFGLLGPNGAGKTTSLEIIEGLRKPDQGEVHINGFNVRDEADEVKQIIGVQLQSTSLFNNIKVDEAIDLYGGYYRKRLSTESLLDLVSLREKRKTFHKNLSGGQQQRLALALALVNDPELVFLDEPTTGLDPQARRNLWEIIRSMKADGKTVILTTHYMEEAEQLCDRLVIMDHGRIIAEGAPYELVGQLKIDSCLRFAQNDKLGEQQLTELPAVTRIRIKNERVELYSRDVQQSIVALIELARSSGVEVEDLHVSQPNLEDLFLDLTGRSLRE